MSDLTFTFHFHALEKEMATHSSVLAWRIPGTGEPGGLQSLGSHRVGHDWSNLAAAAAALNKANIWQKTEVREKFFFLSHLNHSTWEIENAFSKKSNELINKKNTTELQNLSWIQIFPKQELYLSSFYFPKCLAFGMCSVNTFLNG